MNIMLRDQAEWDLYRAVERVIKGGDRKGVTKSCLSCVRFDEKTEQCTKYLTRPPARVIAFSCISYEDSDLIPF